MYLEAEDTITEIAKTNRFREVEWNRCLTEFGMRKWEIRRILPLLRRVEAFTDYDLTHFQFRVWSDESAGANCENGKHSFRSAAVKGGQGAARFENMSEANIKEHLRMHFTWEKGSKADPFYSHWISFTSSILFAFAHAYRKVIRGEKNVMLAVIDTYKIQGSVRMYSAFPLIKSYAFRTQRIKDSAYSEFLVWDELVAEMDVVPFSALLYVEEVPGYKLKGLLKHCPWLRYKDAELKAARARGHGLKSRVGRFRTSLFADRRDLNKIKPEERPISRMYRAKRRKTNLHYRKAGPFGMDTYKLDAFYWIVKPFSSKFRLPMLVALLSTITTEYEQDSMEEQVIEKLKGECMIIVHRSTC